MAIGDPVMRVSLNWLRELVALPSVLTVAELA